MILAIDTSGNDCGVALWGENLNATRIAENKLQHNEIILSEINSLLSENGLPLNSISAVAISSGPGSFTGLRVGMATAKGLAYTLDVPFIAIPTMKGLAASVPKVVGNVLTLMPARSTEVYWALFERVKNQWVQKDEVQIADIQQLKEKCQGSFFPVGEGYKKYTEELNRIFRGRLLRLPENLKPEALVISTAKLAAMRLTNGQSDNLMTEEPEYHYPFRKAN